MRKRASIKGIGATIFRDAAGSEKEFTSRPKGTSEDPSEMSHRAEDESTPAKGTSRSDNLVDFLPHLGTGRRDLAGERRTWSSAYPDLAGDVDQETALTEEERRVGEGRTEVETAMPTGSPVSAPTTQDQGSSPHARAEGAQAGTLPEWAATPDSEDKSDTDADGDTYLSPAERGQEAIDGDLSVQIPPGFTQPGSTGKRLGDLKARTPEERERAESRLGDKAARELLHEIDLLYARITESLTTRTELAQHAMDLLSEARDLLLLGDAGDFNLAERRVNEARLTLHRVEQSRRWSNTYGWGLLVYELVLFLGLVAALLYDHRIAEAIRSATGALPLGTGDVAIGMSGIFPPWNTMLWGAIGGIVGALYSLHWHVSEMQDFDKQYTLWYVTQPFMGLILGGIIHLVIVTGMLTLMPSNPGLEGRGATSIAVQWFPALVACLAGFRQKFTYELLDSLMKVFGHRPEGRNDSMEGRTS